MSEPSPEHIDAAAAGCDPDAYDDAITSLTAITKALAKVTRERDEARARARAAFEEADSWRAWAERAERQVALLTSEIAGRLHERWDDSVAPGGMVCTECGTPVESEPCPSHSIEAMEAERDEIAGRLSALLWELTVGRLSKATYDVRTMVVEIDSVYDDAQREERAERDRLDEVVKRVEALADELDTERRACEKRGSGGGPSTVARKNRTMRRVYERVLVDLRAALSAPEPVPTTPETPHTPAGDAESVSGQSGEGEAPGGALDRDDPCEEAEAKADAIEQIREVRP